MFEKASSEVEDKGDGFDEFVIEWLKNSATATVNFPRGRLATKVKKLAEQCPGECKVVHESKDGVVIAHIPVKWIRISRSGNGNRMSEEQRAAAAERLAAARAKRLGAADA